jgi:hypothetical protein
MKNTASVLLLALCLISTATTQIRAEPLHHCADDAVKQAGKLLRFHGDNDDRAEVDSKTLKVISPIKVSSGKGRLDVLEVLGFIYKGEYRMRMIYAQMPNDCVLMGQEILEMGTPY